LLEEQSRRGGDIALGVAVGSLVVGEVILGLRWVLRWVQRKMGEGLEEKGIVRARRQRRHARDWTELT
jgi:hypothetical protein